MPIVGLFRNSIIHADIKPENILVKDKGRSGVKVIDFGSSCYADELVHNYLQPRFVRAPEVFFGGWIGLPIDMWSFGCTLAELSNGTPLFLGCDEGDQIACIVELLGLPPKSLIDDGKRSEHFLSSNGHPRYCTVTINPGGVCELSGNRSARGVYRGPPGSRQLSQVLKAAMIQILSIL